MEAFPPSSRSWNAFTIPEGQEAATTAVMSNVCVCVCVCVCVKRERELKSVSMAFNRCKLIDTPTHH